MLTKRNDDGRRAGREVARRILAAMDTRGVSKADLAAKLGLTQSAVKSTLQGNNLTQAVKLGQIADILKTTPNYLLSFDDYAPPTEPDIHEGALLAAIISTLRHFGLPDEMASDLARGIVLSAKEKPIDGLDREQAARAIVVSQLRKLAPKE